MPVTRPYATTSRLRLNIICTLHYRGEAPPSGCHLTGARAVRSGEGVQAGLNKGEARNALARAVFLHRLGEIRDRKPENQSYRASGLTLLTAAISLWNTVYMERAVDALKRKGVKINEQLLSHLSPLGWEHINLTGDYIWKSNRIPASGKFRRLRPAKVERSKNNLNEWKGLPLRDPQKI